jgi:hypothetical protein
MDIANETRDHDSIVPTNKKRFFEGIGFELALKMMKYI